MTSDPLTLNTPPLPTAPPGTEGLRCWAEVDLDAIRTNATRLHARTAAPLLCVVKANAYGHGAVPVTRALRARTQYFAVANVREAVEIAGVLGAGDSVLILGPAVPGERAEIVRRRFIPLLSSLEEARAYSALALAQDPGAAPLPVHAKVDIGMGRMGIPLAEALPVITEINQLPGIQLAALAAHLPSPDEDFELTARQLAQFGQLLGEVEAAGLPRLPWHAQNSAAFLHNLEAVGRPPAWVRPGLTLYGVSPTGEAQAELRRPLTWRARVALVRELPAGHGVSYGSTFRTTAATQVATLSLGYADGYPRTISNRGADVLIQGKRCPVLGRVTMDLIMADVTALASRPQPGDPVTLIGRDGDEEITAEELAQKAGTIPWEIFTNLSARVTRVYTGE